MDDQPQTLRAPSVPRGASTRHPWTRFPDDWYPHTLDGELRMYTAHEHAAVMFERTATGERAVPIESTEINARAARSESTEVSARAEHPESTGTPERAEHPESTVRRECIATILQRMSFLLDTATRPCYNRGMIKENTMLLPNTLKEDIDSWLTEEYEVHGQIVRGQPYSTLCSFLRSPQKSGRAWRSLGSGFFTRLQENGYRIEPGKGTKPRQRGSLEVVFKG